MWEIERNLEDGYKREGGNDMFDFYIRKVCGMWFVHAIYKGTCTESTMAGFKTRKDARTCVASWTEWMR